MWNIRLKNIIKNGIESKEYMIIRSSLVLLSKVVQNFPSRRKVGQVLLESVENLEKAETGRFEFMQHLLLCVNILYNIFTVDLICHLWLKVCHQF